VKGCATVATKLPKGTRSVRIVATVGKRAERRTLAIGH
jgi:hypothetical protein